MKCPPDQGFWDKFPRRELPDGASTQVDIVALEKHVELTRNKMTVSEFKRAEKTLKDMVTLMKADGENTNSDPMFKIAYEKMEPVQKHDSAVNYFNEQNYWLYRTHITIEHMTNSFYSSYQSDETLKVLKLLLDKLQQLELVKQLAHLIAMKNALFLNMNRQIDKQQANNILKPNRFYC